MTVNDIITELHRNRIVEQIVRQIGRGEDSENLKDCISDIYLSLLEKPKKKLIAMYEQRELHYFIASMCLRQIRSKTSPYFTKYKKSRLNAVPVIDSMLKTED